MKVKLNGHIQDLNGEKFCEDDGKTYLTIGSACIFAILQANIDSKTPAEEKFKRYQLAQKLYGQSEVELTIDEVAKLKEWVGIAYSPMVMGRIYDYLEGLK